MGERARRTVLLGLIEDAGHAAHLRHRRVVRMGSKPHPGRLSHRHQLAQKVLDPTPHLLLCGQQLPWVRGARGHEQNGDRTAVKVQRFVRAPETVPMLGRPVPTLLRFSPVEPLK